MIGLLLGFIGTFFQELNNSIIKEKTKTFHFITVAVVVTSFSAVLFFTTGIFKYFAGNFTLYFTAASIPLLIIRGFFEILQSYFTILAIKHCDRSTFSILRIITIPLLIIADIVLGYTFSYFSFIGIGIIILSFLVFNTNRKSMNWKGWYYAVFTAINAVFTISLYKYSLTHYGNSVEIDQGFMVLVTLLFFIIYNYKKEKKIGFYLLKKDKIFWIQGILLSLAAVAISYSYLYINASEATAIKRVGEMFWAILAGFYFFKEKQFIKKILFTICIIIGVVVMSL